SAMRDEYDRHVDRLTLFVKENVEVRRIGSSIWDAIEKVSVLVGLSIALSPLVTQWLQGSPFPYYRESATVAAVLIGIYLAARYRTRVFEFFRTKFQRVRSYRRKPKRLTPKAV